MHGNSRVCEVDGDSWLRSWLRVGSPPFAHPAYVALGAAAGSGTETALDVRTGAAEFLLPLIIRELPGPAHGYTRDAVTPYGYGGPYVAGHADAESWRNFWRTVIGWMRERGILTAFCTLPLDSNCPTASEKIDVGTVDVRALGENVVVNAGRSADQQWRHYDHKVRKNVAKARRSGFTCTTRECFTDVDEFVDVYHETMRRRSAHPRYFFDSEYFTRLVNELPRSATRVAEVRDSAGMLASVELLLQDQTSVYSYLGGTRADTLTWGVNDLLKHSVIEYARGRNIPNYVLGGGRSTGDGIFRYKRTFDRDGVVPFRAARLVASTDAYEALSESLLSDQTRSDTAYFPAYRALERSGATEGAAHEKE